MTTTKILLVHSGWFHPPILGRWYLKRFLQQQPHLRLTSVNNLESAAQLGYEKFKAVITYFHSQQISAGALNKLRKFVYSGGGLMGVHSVTASFKENDLWFELIGGRFSGHGPVESIHYQKAAVRHPGFEDDPDFWVRDELYRHELKPGVQAVYEADFEGERLPMIWTYSFGAGRVFYACPGHRAAVFQNAVYRQLLSKGARWVCGN